MMEKKQLPPEQEDANHKWHELHINAYLRFRECLEQRQKNPLIYISYSVVKKAKEAKGGLAWDWGVPSEIRETINEINSWCSRLHEWRTWLNLLPEYEDDGNNDAWEIQTHFIEPLAFYSLFQPSAVAERIIEVAENAMHQANCYIFPDMKDKLDQDNLKPGQQLSFKARKAQLDRLGSRWKNYRVFKELWAQIDSKSYRESIKNFRNLSSHSIPPRFGFGEISRAFRSIVPAQEIIQQPDGLYKPVNHPSKKMISYVIGIQEPLSHELTYEANLQEFLKVKRCMLAFDKLVEEIAAAINRRNNELRKR